MNKILFATMALVLAFSNPASAQVGSYPSKPIRLVVGFPPGGANDIFARLVGAKLQETWGQAVMIDNKPGANAIIATEFVAKAAPDGYTLLIGASGAMTFNPGLYAKLPYDSIRDFAPVTMIGSYPLVLALQPSVPAHTVKELIQIAKSSPGKLNYGAGSTPFQLAAELFKFQAGVSISHVPYKGSAQAVNAVLANVVQLTFVDAPPVVGQIKSGKLRGLAVTSKTRASILPELPTMIEAGLPDFAVVLWTSLFAPAGTPRAIIDKLQREIARVIQLPDMRERFAALGTDAGGITPDQLAAIVKADVEKWTAVAKTANVKAD